MKLDDSVTLSFASPFSRITNRIFRRNGHSPSFDQSRRIELAGDNGKEPVLDKEFAAFTSPAMLGGTLGLVNDMPVLSQKSLYIVDQMMQDDMVGTCIELKKVAAFSAPPTWEPASDDSEHIKHADYLNEVFAKLDGGEEDSDGVNIGLTNKIRDMASAIEYGYSITNVVYGILQTGDFTGKVGIRDMKTKPPHTFSFDTDEFLNIKPDGIIYGQEGGRPERLPLEQFIVYTYRAQRANPYGYADTIRAYDRWNSKRWVQKMWDIFLEVHACGTFHATYDRNDAPGAQERAAVISLLEGAQARSGLFTSDRITLTKMVADAGAASVFPDAIDARNQQIARALFNPDLTGFSAKDTGGSYSLGKKQFDMYLMILTSLQADISAVMKPVGRKLVTMSYGAQDQTPKLVFPPLTDETKVWFLSSVGQAVKDGVLQPDQAVVNRVREILELPEAEDSMPIPRLQPGENPNDPNAPNAPQPGDAPEPEPEEQDYADSFVAPDPEAVIAAALSAIQRNERTVIIGGPKSAKTTVATLAAERFKLKARYADSLIGSSDWSGISERVSEWFDAPGSWVVEGVATVRAVRKWLASHPGQAPPFATVVMQGAIQQRGKAHQAMASGVTTIWNEIQPELEARGAKVVVV